MKKRVLALVMSTAMIASVMTACGSKSETPAADTSKNEQTAPAAENNTATEGDTTAATEDLGTGEVTIWVAENVTDFTSAQIAKFQEENPQYAGYTVKVEPVGEGDAAASFCDVTNDA